MDKIFRIMFLTLILFCFGFSSDFVKKEVNIYINDVISNKVNVIEKLYFKDNISYSYKKKYLNNTFLLNKLNLSMNASSDIKTNLIGDNLEILEIKYSSKPFKISQKTGRFIREAIDSTSFPKWNNNSSLVLNNKTTLKFEILKKINSNFIIPEDIKNIADVYLSEDRSYIVYEFDGPKTLPNFKIIKEYKEPMLYFDPGNVWNPFYILTFLIIFVLCIIYFKDIVLLIKKVFE